MTTSTPPQTSKECSRCGTLKPLSEYHKSKKIKSGYRAHCKECHKKHCREYYATSHGQEQIRGAQLKKAYGISLEEYNLLLKKQDGKCAICGTEECRTGKAFAVDHCHETGEVRGLLCRPCNSALGFFNDNYDTCQKAADYLRNTASASNAYTTKPSDC